jgi:short-subunit dehydrogenase
MTSASGKWALITGASAGLGRDFAKLFAADGHRVILVARRLERLEQLAGELKDQYGVEAHAIKADLSAPEAPAAVFEEVQRLGCRIEYLVNNAGYGSNGPFLEQEVDRELSMVDVNVRSLVHLTHLFAPAMVERGYGRILNLGSVAGFQPGPFMATYYASKAFVNHFSEALASELAGTGVTVTVSCPGPVATEFGAIAGNDRARVFTKGAVATSESVAVSAYRAMMKGKRMVVHGLSAKLGVQMLRLAPRSVVQSFTRKLNQP